MRQLCATRRGTAPFNPVVLGKTFAITQAKQAMEQYTACFDRGKKFIERGARKRQAKKAVDADEEKMRAKTDTDIQTRFEQAEESGGVTGPDYGSATYSESEPFQMSLDFWGAA